VKVLLASRSGAELLLGNSRNWYAPGARFAGIGNGHEPEARGTFGDCEQLTYIQSMYWLSPAFAGMRPNQSSAVGAATLLHVPVTVPPAATVVGLTISEAPGAIVKVLLVKRRVYSLFAKRRSSYEPAESALGILNAQEPEGTAAPEDFVQLTKTQSI
jgi:hypothetical protein